MTAPLPQTLGPSIKGWCPGALKPMRSGDGLVVRLRLPMPIVPAVLARALADLARTHGNGQIDLTQRANLQLRGVSDETWPDLIEKLDSLGVLDADAEVEAVKNIVVSPLVGLEDGAQINALAAAEVLRSRIAEDTIFRQLPAKFAFVIDDGGAFPLDEVVADIRFVGVEGRVAVEIGDFRRLTIVDPAEVGDVAARLVRAFLALRTDESRMQRLIARVGPAAIAEVAGFGCEAIERWPVRESADVIGFRDLPLTRPSATLSHKGRGASKALPETSRGERTGVFPPLPLWERVAEGRVRGSNEDGAADFLGLGIPFGRLTADGLTLLADVASRHGSGEIRLTPWRAVLLPNASDTALPELETAGFITSPDDPRFSVIACPGAPECESGFASVRTDALALASLAAQIPGSGIKLHVSGCAKGCARPQAAPATLIAGQNGYDLVQNGRAGDRPVSTGLTRQAIEGVLRTLIPEKHVSDRATYIRDGAEIYRHSFAIIRREADLARFAPEEEPVAVRMIHASGMVEIASDIAFAPGAAAAAKAALRSGAPIFADAEMVARGVTRARLPAGNDVLCTLTDPRVPEMAIAAGTTRSAAAMDLWRERLGGSVVAIGNAPTSLYRLLEMLDEGAGLPACVIGMPVGFVGAAESKDALIADGRVPYIVIRGRKGGSAMAAAAVNALASDRE